MKRGIVSRNALGLTAALACVAVLPRRRWPTPALRLTPLAARRISSQPFLTGKDSSWYAMAPGEQTDSFPATGWTLSGGAKLVSTQLADGALGSVLDLPTGAQAVSPVMCVSSDYQRARAEVRSLSGGGSVGLSVAYEGTASWSDPQHVGDLTPNKTSWTLPNTIGLQPSSDSGWQLVQFTLTGNKTDDTSREYQVYNLAAQASATLAEASVDTSACTPPQLWQPFTAANDFNWYTPTPGESDAGFDGAGWTLSNGASTTLVELPTGATGPVLDLPSGAKAVSPVMCVTSDYPTARAVMRNVSASNGSVGLYVAYNGTKSWNNAQHSADLSVANGDWGLSGNANIQPGKQAGWQLVQITLIGNGTGKHVQLLNFEIDPRMRS